MIRLVAHPDLLADPVHQPHQSPRSRPAAPAGSRSRPRAGSGPPRAPRARSPSPMSSALISCGAPGRPGPGRCPPGSRSPRCGWWNGAGTSIRPRSVAIEAVRGDQDGHRRGQRGDGAAVVAQADGEVEVDAGVGQRRGRRDRRTARRGTGARRSAGRSPCRAARRRPGPGRAAGPSGACRRRSRGRPGPGGRSPSAPEPSSCWSRRTIGLQRIHIASIRKRSLSRASATRCSASAALRVSDFSQSTALPASRASSTCSRCRACGVATYTTSTSGSSTSAR